MSTVSSHRVFQLASGHGVSPVSRKLFTGDLRSESMHVPRKKLCKQARATLSCIEASISPVIVHATLKKLDVTRNERGPVIAATV